MAINTMNVGVTNKGTPQTLFGGNLAASVAEANATVIDMQGYTGGALECQRNSGAGTWSIQLYAHESANNGTFIVPKIQFYGADANGALAASTSDFPALAARRLAFDGDAFRQTGTLVAGADSRGAGFVVFRGWAAAGRL